MLTKLTFAALEVPEEVCGYREVRYPKMETAKQKVESLLSKVST